MFVITSPVPLLIKLTAFTFLQIHVLLSLVVLLMTNLSQIKILYKILMLCMNHPLLNRLFNIQRVKKLWIRNLLIFKLIIQGMLLIFLPGKKKLININGFSRSNILQMAVFKDARPTWLSSVIHNNRELITMKLFPQPLK